MEHGRVAARIAARLLRFAEAQALGYFFVETGCIVAHQHV
jgi:hypothetical protein